MKKILFSGITALLLCSTLAYGGDKKPAHKTAAGCACTCCACDDCKCTNCTKDHCTCTKCAGPNQCNTTANNKSCCAKK